MSTISHFSRRAAKSAHPDKGGSEAKMAAVNEAYEVLLDPGEYPPNGIKDISNPFLSSQNFGPDSMQVKILMTQAEAVATHSPEGPAEILSLTFSNKAEVDSLAEEPMDPDRVVSSSSGVIRLLSRAYMYSV